MSDSSVPDHVRDFLLVHIHSVAHLEALLLLREHDNEQWNVAHLSQRLYIDEADAGTILNALVASNLITEKGSTFQFGPLDDEQRLLVDAVAANYAQRLVPVTRIIHEKGTSAYQFANAFRFGKDK